MREGEGREKEGEAGERGNKRPEKKKEIFELTSSTSISPTVVWSTTLPTVAGSDT